MNGKRVRQRRYSGVTDVLQVCKRSVTGISQRCFSGVTGILQIYYRAQLITNCAQGDCPGIAHLGMVLAINFDAILRT